MSTALLIELLPVWLAIAGGLFAAVRWALRLTRTLDQVRDVLMPPDGPSLRTTVTDHGTRLLVLEQQRINPDAIPVIR
jgi:hypothetical protein